MNEETIKENLERINLIIEAIPKVKYSEDKKSWTMRNLWALGIKNDLEKELNSQIKPKTK